MLPKKNRNDRKNIEELFKLGTFAGSPNLNLRFILTGKSFSPKISFITPKNVSKQAAVRNLLRRRGYGTLKKYLNKFPPGFLGAIVFGRRSADLFAGRKNKKRDPIQNLENEIRIVLSKI